LSDVGLELAEENSRLQIKSAKEDSPFARCGFRSGDCLLAADGKRIESADDFRRVVRRYLAESVMEPKSLPVQAERAGKKIELTLELN
jgi:S1-C subfamily serine protease